MVKLAKSRLRACFCRATNTCTENGGPTCACTRALANFQSPLFVILYIQEGSVQLCPLQLFFLLLWGGAQTDTGPGAIFILPMYDTRFLVAL